MSNSDSPAPGLVDRVQSFVSENKRAILIGTAVAAVAVAYYASSSRPSKSPKKDKKKNKKRKTDQDVNGPILEERAPTVADSDDPNFGKLSLEEITAMATEERSKLALELKSKGNQAYSSHKFEQAVEYYSRAINVTPKREPVFYSNRAACYMNITPTNYELVVKDCDDAIALDKNYIKALNRRAVALESLERYEDSLRDFTAATILENFQNEATAVSVERVLKKLSSEKATAILATRETRLPSYTFISAYFSAFRPRSLPVLPENPSTGDQTLILALEALKASDYIHAQTFVSESLEQGLSTDLLRAEALNLRGTFKFLVSDVTGAKEDLQASIDLAPEITQTWVKIASVHMEQTEPEKAFEAFEQAKKYNAEDPDIYYHRGQVLFIMNEFKDAAENYSQSTNLDDQFVFSHIQLAVAQYKQGNLANSMATFRKTLKAFPERSEPPNYYGELLLDQGRFADAVEKFDRAIEMERKNTPMNVLPIVNKGLALYQWQQDVKGAEECCNEALQIDPQCEAAVATLAQLSLQQGNVDKAVEMFQRQVDLARSEAELTTALTYQYASLAQMTFVQNYPEKAGALSALARQM